MDTHDRRNKNKRLPVSLWMLACLAPAVVGLRTITNPGIWMHLAAGRLAAEGQWTGRDVLSFTRPGAEWINPSWLYDRVLYALWQGGPALVIVVHVLLLTASFLLLWPAARRYGNAAAAGAALLCAWLVSPRWEFSPAAAGLLCAACFLAALERPGFSWKLPALLLPVQWMWTNMHTGFLLGPLFCLVYALQALLRPGRFAGREAAEHKKRAYALIGMTGACLLISLLNPAGFRLHSLLLNHMRGGGHQLMTVWISPFSELFAASRIKHLFTLALLTGAAGLLTQRRSLPVASTILAVGSAGLIVLFRSMRYVDFFALMAFPFLAMSLQTTGCFVLAKSGASERTGQRVAAGLLVAWGAATLFCFVTNRYYIREGHASRFGLGVEWDLFPAQALAVLDEEGLPERMIHQAVDGGFLAFHAPQRGIFVDERRPVYGNDFYRLKRQALYTGNPAAWNRIMEEWQPGAVLLSACSRHAPLALHSLSTGQRWIPLYFDGTSVLLVPRTPAREARARQLNARGMELIDREFKAYRRRLGGLFRPPVPPRLVGAAAVFMSLEYYREAAALYSALTRGAPAMDKGWLYLGICQIELERWPAAVEALEQASRRMPKNAQAWLWLGRAYAGNGQDVRAERAYTRAARLDPHAAEQFGAPGHAFPSPTLTP